MNTVPTETTAETTMVDVDDLTARVKQMYRDVALHPERDYHFETGRALAERLGYPPANWTPSRSERSVPWQHEPPAPVRWEAS